METHFLPAIKSGRAWNGSHRDSGIIVHAVEPLPPTTGGDWFTKSLCGTEPGRRGNGWSSVSRDINCLKCLKIIETQQTIKSKSMEEIYSVSEAFSMQPKTWYVGQSMPYSINPTHRPVISKIKIEDIYDTGDPFSFYVGYSSDGYKLFQIRVQCATVEFIPKPDPKNNQKAQSE